MAAHLESLLRSKLFILALLFLPGLYTFWPFFMGDATVEADPLKYILHHLGFTAAVLLALVLSLSPLRVIFAKSKLVGALNRHRRMIGVTVFVYAALHLTTHFLYEGGFSTFLLDVWKPFIFTGLIAFTILLALAATSFNSAVKRLGGRGWKWLHRAVYLAACLVIYHQIAARKVFPMQVVYIFLPLLLLELVRIVLAVRKSKRPIPIRSAVKV